jgi:hypothetical protein
MALDQLEQLTHQQDTWLMKRATQMFKRRICYGVIAAIALLILNIVTVSSQSMLDISTVLLEWSPNGTLLALATANGVEIYDANLDLIGTLPDYSEQVVSISWHPEGEFLAGVGYPFDFHALPTTLFTSSLLVWHREIDNTFTLEQKIDYPDTNNILAVVWSPDGTMVAVSEEDWIEGTPESVGHISVYETTNWTKISETSNAYSRLRTPVWNVDSTIIAAMGRGICYVYADCEENSDEAAGDDVFFLTDPLSGNRLDFEVINVAVLSFDWSASNQIALPSGFLKVFDVTKGVKSAIEYDIDAFADGTIWRTDTELIIQAYPDEVLVFDTVLEEVVFRQTISDLWAITLHPSGSITVLTEDYHLLTLNPTR